MTSALIVIDVQNDFCSGGALEVPEGDQIVAPINLMIDDASIVILSQDWHPKNHTSFAENHEGSAPFDVIEMPYGSQTLWPIHCVMGSHGAEFHRLLNTSRANAVIRKGSTSTIDSYSTFFENDRKTPTGLSGLLRECGVKTLTLVGLATDFCVAFSALDAISQGFEVNMPLHACRAINNQGSLGDALEKLKLNGVHLM